MFFCFFFFFYSFFMLGVYFLPEHSVFLEFPFCFTYFFDSSFVFQFDSISFFFSSFVAIISSMVFLYSKFYNMEILEKMNLSLLRFYYLVFFFVLSMFFLVFSGSWFLVMVGWDGLGIVSFLLVVYYSDGSSLNSGLTTIFSNRVGDCFFIISFMFFFFVGWPCQDFLMSYTTFFFFIIFFLGCITKSAQVPFSSWLPAAMSAPTPVSSLVHSSTLVTAGIYVLMRFNYLFVDYFYLMTMFSLMTMFFAGICAVWEKDFKKVVAMSTLSQLGFILFSLSLGLTLFSFMHMVFHAFFKSSLFLATGNLMCYLSGNQDSRFFGAMGSSFVTKVVFSVSCLSLMGFPFSLGFYSKDIILGGLLFTGFSFYSLVFYMSCVFTISYSVRLFSLVFFFTPAFSSLIYFKDYYYFFFSVFMLYFFCVFIGNGAFFFFTFPCVLNFMDTTLGLIIISLGLFFYQLSGGLYLLDSYVSGVGFFSFFNYLFSSFLISNSFYSNDSSWSEIMSYSFIGYSNKVLTYMSFLFFVSLYFFIFFLFYFLLFF